MSCKPIVSKEDDKQRRLVIDESSPKSQEHIVVIQIRN